MGKGRWRRYWAVRLEGLDKLGRIYGVDISGETRGLGVIADVSLWRLCGEC